MAENARSCSRKERAGAPVRKNSRGVLKNPSVYDKFSNRMKSRRRFTVAVLSALACLLAMATLSCDVSPVPGRFTYIVKYEVTSDAAVSVDIDYTDETGAAINIPGQVVDPATPWIYEFPAAFNYDDPPFYATLAAVAAAPFAANEAATAKIIWKDYRLDFQDQVLAFGSLYNDGSIVVDAATLTSPELPRP
jgi:hypothetical protein